jgi:hypothetical protein
MKIEVSHESPISCLEKSLEYNDYGYALVHLFEERPEYFNFFKTLRTTTDIPVLLDNSIFELGKAFDSQDYIKWIDKLDPNYYIVPDVLYSGIDTIRSWVEFNCHLLPAAPRQIGVATGRDWSDIIECYQFMSDNADYIALGFNLPYFEHTGTGITKLERWCTGRQRLVHHLIDEGIWNWNKPHHLLGCSLAREFRYYVDNNIYNIKSCDTSNPVVASIKGIQYNDDFGLLEKPSTLLADLIDYEMDDSELELLDYNVKMFKKILRR